MICDGENDDDDSVNNEGHDADDHGDEERH